MTLKDVGVATGCISLFARATARAGPNRAGSAHDFPQSFFGRGGFPATPETRHISEVTACHGSAVHACHLPTRQFRETTAAGSMEGEHGADRRRTRGGGCAAPLAFWRGPSLGFAACARLARSLNGCKPGTFIAFDAFCWDPVVAHLARVPQIALDNARWHIRSPDRIRSDQHRA